jgi:large subunit ribosomal protein L9
MAKTIELLLTDNVDSLGIVGDVVKVRTGYARNFLLPRALATTPSEEKIKELAARRIQAERALAEQRSLREKMIEAIEGVEITLERTCNDMGMLYGSVTQQDVAEALVAKGFNIRPRDVRLAQTIKRIDSYEVLIKPESDLEANIKLWVVSDRPLEMHRDHGKHEAKAEAAPEAAEGAEGAEAASEEKPARSKRKRD